MAVKLPDVKQKISIVDGYTKPLKHIVGAVAQARIHFRNLKKAVDEAGKAEGLKNLKKYSDKIKSSASGIGSGFMASGKRAAAFAGVMTAATGAATGAIGKVVTSTADYGRSVARASTMLGVGTTEIQELRHAAQRSGLEVENFDRSLIFLAKSASGAARGGKAQKQLFKEIGVSATDAAGNARPLDDLFMELSGKFAEMPDKTKRVGLAMRLFGRSGATMIPMLDKGAAGIKQLRREAHELGTIMDKEAIANSRTFGATVKQTKLMIGGLTRELGSMLLPAIIDMAKEFQNFVKYNRPQIRTFFQYIAQAVPKVAGYMIRAAVAIKNTLGPIFSWIWSMVNKIGFERSALFALGAWILGPFVLGLAKVIPLVINVVKWLRVAIPVVRGFMLALGVSAGPIGWVVLAITALISVIILFRKELAPVGREFAKGFNPIIEDAIGLWKEIKKSWKQGAEAINGIGKALGFTTPILDLFGQLYMGYLGKIARLTGLIMAFPIRAFLFYMTGVLKAFNLLVEYATAAGSALKTKFGPQLEWLGNKVGWVVGKVEALIGLFKSLAGKVREAGGGILKRLGIAPEQKTIEADTDKDLGAFTPESKGRRGGISFNSIVEETSQRSGGYRTGTDDTSLARKMKEKGAAGMTTEELLKYSAMKEKQQTAKISVDIKGLPRGSRAETSGNADIDLDTGYAMEEVY